MTRLLILVIKSKSFIHVVIKQNLYGCSCILYDVVIIILQIMALTGNLLEVIGILSYKYTHTDKMKLIEGQDNSKIVPTL